MRGLMFRSWKIAAIAASPPDRIWQTRRAIKELNKEPDRWEYMRTNADHRALFWVIPDDPEPDRDKRLCLVKPRYRPGEVVYIKEAVWYPPFIHNQNQSRVAYRLVVSLNCGEEAAAKSIWHNPRFMPAWAARLFIKILKVEACRTKDISFEDCLAEGVIDSPFWQNLDYKAPAPLHPENLSNAEADKEIDRGWIEYARQAYFALWEDINGKGSLSSNPWVWCYQFVKTARPEAER